MIYHSGPPDPLGRLIACFTGNIALPMFFFLSGYLFNYEKYSASAYSFVYKKISRLLAPFFVTYFFAITFLYFANQFANHFGLSIPSKVSTNVLDQIAAMFYGNGANNPNFLVIPLWFVLCLFCSNIIFYIYLSLINNKNEFLGIFLCVLIALIGYSISRYIFLPWSFDIALVSLMFMYLGYLAKNHSILDQLNGKLKTSQLIFLILAFFALFYINGDNDINSRIYGNLILFFLISIIGITLSLIAVTHLQRYTKIENLFGFLGINSIAVLAFHVVWKGYIVYSIKIIEPGYGFILENWFTTFFLMVTSSLITIYVFNKIWILKKIYTIDCSSFNQVSQSYSSDFSQVIPNSDEQSAHAGRMKT